MAENGEQGVSIGRIPLKQVRVKRCDGEEVPETPRARNPMNALVPYLDLFCRLGDDELARLAQVEAEVVANLRTQVVTVDEGLAPYVDLLPRLSDDELARLTGATLKTIRFWRLCQPSLSSDGGAAARGGWVAAAARVVGGLQESPSPHPTPPSELEPKGPSDSGLHEQALDPTECALARLRNLARASHDTNEAEESGPLSIE